MLYYWGYVDQYLGIEILYLVFQLLLQGLIFYQAIREIKPMPFSWRNLFFIPTMLVIMVGPKLIPAILFFTPGTYLSGFLLGLILSRIIFSPEKIIWFNNQEINNQDINNQDVNGKTNMVIMPGSTQPLILVSIWLFLPILEIIIQVPRLLFSPFLRWWFLELLLGLFWGRGLWYSIAKLCKK